MCYDFGFDRRTSKGEGLANTFSPSNTQHQLIIHCTKAMRRPLLLACFLLSFLVARASHQAQFLVTIHALTLSRVRGLL